EAGYDLPRQCGADERRDDEHAETEGLLHQVEHPRAHAYHSTSPPITTSQPPTAKNSSSLSGTVTIAVGWFTMPMSTSSCATRRSTSTSGTMMMTAIVSASASSVTRNAGTTTSGSAGVLPCNSAK